MAKKGKKRQEGGLPDFMSMQYAHSYPYQGPEVDDDEDDVDPNAGIMERLNDLQRRFEASERERMALLSAAPQTQTTPQAPSLNMEGLPDPVTDPERYASEVARRTQQFIADNQAYTQQTTRKEQSMQEKVQGLWSEFEGKYGDYASNQDRVEFAAQKVVARAQSRGVDVERYMFTTRDTFMEDVKKEMDNIFGPIGGKKGDDDDDADRQDTIPSHLTQHRQSQPRNPRADDEDDGRSASVFGGMESAGRHTRQQRREDTSDMIAEIHEMQKKSGFY